MKSIIEGVKTLKVRKETYASGGVFGWNGELTIPRIYFQWRYKGLCHTLFISKGRGKDFTLNAGGYKIYDRNN